MLEHSSARINAAKSKGDDSDDTEITIFHKTGGILSKRISLTKSGVIDADGSECWMSKGEASRKKLNGPASLADLIDNMPSEQALALGRLKPGLPDVVEIARKQDLDASAPGTIARTGDYLYFEPGKPAYMLFDHDRKGMPGAVRAKLKEVGGFWNAMTQAIPGLAGAARVTRRSTSTGLYHAKTSESLSGSLNRHVYISAKDGSDIARALTTVQDRLWLAGYGYFVVGAAGQLLVRSIIDAAVYGPERLVFEGAPELVPPVAQDATKRQARAFRGTIIDTALAIPSLNEEESEPR